MAFIRQIFVFSLFLLGILANIDGLLAEANPEINNIFGTSADTDNASDDDYEVVEPTEAPVEPTEEPVEPTDGPVEIDYGLSETEEPTEAPVFPTEEPTDLLRFTLPPEAQFSLFSSSRTFPPTETHYPTSASSFFTSFTSTGWEEEIDGEFDDDYYFSEYQYFSDQYRVICWLCDPNTLEEWEGRYLPKRIVLDEPFSQGSIVTVCVAPDEDSHADGIVISSIDSFFYYRDVPPVMQGVVTNGEAAEGFISYDEGRFKCDGSDWCSVSTILKDDFFNMRREVFGVGTVTLENKSGKRLKSGDSTAPFDIVLLTQMRERTPEFSISECSEYEERYEKCYESNFEETCRNCPDMGLETPLEILEKLKPLYAPSFPEHAQFFCKSIRDNICAEFATDACCCGEEMTQWQQCLIEKNNPTFNLTIDAESFSLVDESASCIIDCTPEIHISRFCTQELSTANSCVQSEAACTECFEPVKFMDTFPDQVDWYFRSTFSFTDPTSEDFCLEANWRVCKKFYPPEHGEASCCCLAETKEYMQCILQESNWKTKFGVTDKLCRYDGCEMFDFEKTIKDKLNEKTVEDTPKKEPVLSYEGVCSEALIAANSCVHSTSVCEDCFEPDTFMDTFPEEAEWYFRQNLAFVSSTDPDWCTVANERVSREFNPHLQTHPQLSNPFLNTPSSGVSCCCTTETQKYMQCMFQSGWLNKYGVLDTACEYSIQDFDETDKSKKAPPRVDMIIGGLAIGILVGFLFVYVYFNRRQKDRPKQVEIYGSHWSPPVVDPTERDDSGYIDEPIDPSDTESDYFIDIDFEGEDVEAPPEEQELGASLDPQDSKGKTVFGNIAIVTLAEFLEKESPRRDQFETEPNSANGNTNEDISNILKNELMSRRQAQMKVNTTNDNGL